MDLSLLKLVLLLAVLAAATLGGAVPLLQRNGPSSTRFLGFGNALAAGVFLGAGLIHMLPDAHAAFSSLGVRYPLAFLLATAAIAALFLVEHVLLPQSAHEMVHAAAGEPFAELEQAERHGVGAYVVLTALSLHSLLAGLALGAQTDVAAMLVIFAAILAHKTMEGFALGVSLVRNAMPRKRAWGLLAVYVAATPLGIGIGTLLDVALDGLVLRWLEAGFLALAAGTFVYVATFEILRDELLAPSGRLSMWLLVVLGAGLMGLLALWV